VLELSIYLYSAYAERLGLALMPEQFAFEAPPDAELN
jgi:hypothetical protein